MKAVSRTVRDAFVFVGPKVVGVVGVPAATALLRHALIQASLDPAVTKIEHLASAQYRGAEVPIGMPVFHRGGCRIAVDVVGERPVSDIDEHDLVLRAIEEAGLVLQTLSQSEIRREPRFSNCVQVWSYANHRVAIGDRIRIMQLLAEEGHMRILDIVRTGPFRGDPGAALMALACADVVELELNATVLGPATMVRIRRGKH